MNISVIIATYNSEKTIKNTLVSLMNQTYRDFEVIVIDGKSSDFTCEIINNLKFDRITKFISEKDLGVYDAFNKGLSYSKGNWIIFIGSDDILKSRTTLEEINLYLNAEIDILYTKVSIGNKLFVPHYNRFMLLRNMIHHQGAIYNKKLFEKFRYNSDYKISADYELNLKSYLENRKSQYVDCIFSLCGEIGLSSKANIIGYEEEISIRNKYIKNKYLCFILNLLTRVRRNIKLFLIFQK